MIPGSTSFSLTPLWQQGADPTELFSLVASTGCGPALEVLGHQVWRNFPDVAGSAVDAFRNVIERTGLRPTALDVEIDVYRHRHAPLDERASLRELRTQLAAAGKLGFPLVRATPGWSPSMLRSALDAAEDAAVILTFELQGPTRPGDRVVADILDLIDRTSSPYLGLTLDFSLAGPGLPASMDVLLDRLGADARLITEIHDIWATPADLARRIELAMAAIGERNQGDQLRALVPSMFVRTSSGRVSDWVDLIPFTKHAHAKFWDPDPEAVRPSHTEWLTTLARAGYGGAVVSEWGGHDLLDSADADPLVVTQRHVAMLREIIRSVEQTAGIRTIGGGG